MSENDEKGFSVDIPEDAIQEALESVGKRDRPAPDEETVVAVEVEASPEEEEANGQKGPGPTREELIETVEKLRSEAKAARDRMLRIAADADNTRKRAIKERNEAIKFGQEGLLRDLLPALDNLERTLAHIPPDPGDPVVQGLKEGLGMILKQFQDTLAKHDLTGFSSMGEMFDPTRHEALNKKETDEAEPGTVLEELHRGYLLHDRLLRAALVTVACQPGECAKTEGQEEPAKEQTDEET
jgi:molecular chaperone GrpE